MRPVLRLFFSSVVTVLNSSSALSATQLPPLPEQKIPFAAAKQSKIKQFKTKMVDESFIAGSKSLKVDCYGAVSYTASGQQIATIYLPLRLTNAKGRTIKYLGTNHDFPEEYFKDKSPQLEHSKDGFKFTKVIINNGEEARLYGQVKMLADGRVEFFYKWDDFKSGKFHISPYSIMIDTPIGIAGNSAYRVDGKTMRIPEKPSQGIIYRVKHFKNIMLFADRPGASLDIAAGKGCKAFQIMVQKRLVKFRIYPKGSSFFHYTGFQTRGG